VLSFSIPFFADIDGFSGESISIEDGSSCCGGELVFLILRAAGVSFFAFPPIARLTARFGGGGGSSLSVSLSEGSGVFLRSSSESLTATSSKASDSEEPESSSAGSSFRPPAFRLDDLEASVVLDLLDS